MNNGFGSDVPTRRCRTNSRGVRFLTQPFDSARYSRPVSAALRALAGNSDGNPMTKVSITDVKHGFVSACGDAKLENFRFHDLRHTFATRLADQGVPQAAITEMLGQTSLRMSQRYTHAVIETMQAAVEKLCKTNAAAGLSHLSPASGSAERTGCCGLAARVEGELVAGGRSNCRPWGYECRSAR